MKSKILTEKVTEQMLAAIAESLEFRLAGVIDESKTGLSIQFYEDAKAWIDSIIERIAHGDTDPA